MKVVVRTVGTQVHTWDHAEATFDKTVLQVVYGGQTITFPLVNVLYFTTSESGHPK